MPVQVVVADVGIYREDGAEPKLFSMEKSDLRELPEKEADGNKGTFGKVLAVAGSSGHVRSSIFECFSEPLQQEPEWRNRNTGGKPNSASDDASGGDDFVHR